MPAKLEEGPSPPLRVHVLIAAADHVVPPAGDADVALLVAADEVACLEPPISVNFSAVVFGSLM